MKLTRRRIGIALVIVSVLSLIGGELAAVVTARASLNGTGGDTLVAAPASGPGRSGLYLVRIFTFDQLPHARMRLLEHAAALLSRRQSAKGVAKPVADIEPLSYDVDLDGSGILHYWLRWSVAARTNRASASYKVKLHPRTSPRAASHPANCLFIPTGRSASGRGVTGRGTAVFPSDVYPPYVDAHTVILVDPAPAGSIRIPFREVQERQRKRIDFAISSMQTGENMSTGSEEGFSFHGGDESSRISTFAAVMLVVGTLGVGLAVRKGWALAPWFLIIPILLAGVDRIAYAFQEGDVYSQDIEVRAAAMCGLAKSVGFADTGRVHLRSLSAGSHGALARSVLTTIPAPSGPRHRELVNSSAAWIRFLRHPNSYAPINAAPDPGEEHR